MNFKVAKNKAIKVAQNKKRLMVLLRLAILKLQNTEDRHELISNAKIKLSTMARMVKAYVKGDYQEIPWKSIVLVTAGLIYFVNPFDVVPDIIPVAGLMDDAAVIFWIFNTIGKEVDEFGKWESNFKTSTPE